MEQFLNGGKRIRLSADSIYEYAKVTTEALHRAYGEECTEQTKYSTQYHTSMLLISALIQALYDLKDLGDIPEAVQNVLNEVIKIGEMPDETPPLMY